MARATRLRISATAPTIVRGNRRPRRSLPRIEPWGVHPRSRTPFGCAQARGSRPPPTSRGSLSLEHTSTARRSPPTQLPADVSTRGPGVRAARSRALDAVGATQCRSPLVELCPGNADHVVSVRAIRTGTQSSYARNEHPICKTWMRPSLAGARCLPGRLRLKDRRAIPPRPLRCRRGSRVPGEMEAFRRLGSRCREPGQAPPQWRTG